MLFNPCNMLSQIVLIPTEKKILKLYISQTVILLLIYNVSDLRS